MFPKLFTIAALTSVITAAQAQTVNMDYVIDNMRGTSEALVINPKYDWQKTGSIIQYAPSGQILPQWWAGTRPAWCYTAISWYTAYEAAGNLATNTRVQIRNLRMYTLSHRTQWWSRIDMAPAPYTELWKYPFVYAGDFKAASVKTESSGGYSVKPAYPSFHHGYGKKLTLTNPSDVRAVYIAMEFRLVVADPSKPDDRAKARYVVNAGGDYYPGNGVSWGVGYAPGIGGGKYLLATNNWRTATMLVPNTRMGSTFAEMRNNPPPLTAPAL